VIYIRRRSALLSQLKFSRRLSICRFNFRRIKQKACAAAGVDIDPGDSPSIEHNQNPAVICAAAGSSSR